ncbi:MAG: hypothetical protein JWN34_366 [Bryobacterales bacterium]|nr:hypothetical protein [Bryobacterales bacterium]
MWLSIASAGLRLVSLAGTILGWFTRRTERQQGREDQQLADVKAELATVKKQRDSLAQPVTGNPFDNGDF